MGPFVNRMGLTCNHEVAYYPVMEPVFVAVADPTRRLLLERLRASGPLSISALGDGLPMTRQAVTKHLAILRDSGLISVRKAGREQLHELDAAPLREVDAWLRPYAAAWDDRLAALRRHLGEENER
jgi:DNA-binding transcriptional ArsR family regulator